MAMVSRLVFIIISEINCKLKVCLFSSKRNEKNVDSLEKYEEQSCFFDYIEYYFFFSTDKPPILKENNKSKVLINNTLS